LYAPEASLLILYEHFEQVCRTKKTKPKTENSPHRVCGRVDALVIRFLDY